MSEHTVGLDLLATVAEREGSDTDAQMSSNNLHSNPPPGISHLEIYALSSAAQFGLGDSSQAHTFPTTPVENINQDDESPPSTTEYRPQRGQWVRVVSAKQPNLLGFVLNTEEVIVADPAISILPLVLADSVPLTAPSAEELSSLHRFAYQGMLTRGTMEEFEAFSQCSEPILKRLVQEHTSPGLAAGARVVVVSGYYEGSSGFIAGIRRQSSGSEPRIFAKIVPDVTGKYTPEATDYFLVEIREIKRHALDFTFAFRVGDRVRSIYDSQVQGSITGINFSEDRITISCAEHSAELHIDETVRVWCEGDLVRVRCGEYKGVIGYIIAVHAETGILVLYDIKRYGVWNGDRRVRVRSADVDFDISNHRASPGQDQIQLTQHVQGGTFDNSRRYTNMSVVVVETGVAKGFEGKVIGDHDSQGRAEMLRVLQNTYGLQRAREEERYHFGILLTVQKATGEKMENIPIENVAHQRSLKRLVDQRGLPTPNVDISTASPQNSRSRSVTPCNEDTSGALWPDSKRIGLEGEGNGDWLSVQGLAGKRLDVIVAGVAQIDSLAARIRSMDGRRGYLLLTKDVPRRDPKRRNLVKPGKEDKVFIYGATAGGQKHPIEPKYLRPCRLNDEKQSILHVPERVVVLAADVNGDTSRLGSYGQTAPEHKHDNEGVVAVKFLDGVFQFFHLHTLCLSKNIRIECVEGVFAATEF
ncbi:hypothetical protein R3P38DRAFT_3475575 [Favolaschia claudopus]|uniref:Chromatin elongation factor SPT5 n=1 Tax=Favolaschia claudopus TaxID=2862362 RepID=A0AAW0CHY9_9AGAR